MYGGGEDPNIFSSLFSQNPELYFTYLLYTCIYHIFGCAARDADARFPTQRLVTSLVQGRVRIETQVDDELIYFLSASLAIR